MLKEKLELGQEKAKTFDFLAKKIASVLACFVEIMKSKRKVWLKKLTNPFPKLSLSYVQKLTLNVNSKAGKQFLNEKQGNNLFFDFFA